MASEVIWRKLSDKEKKEVEEKAKNIMFEFGKSIEKLPDVREAFVERVKDRREEELENKNNNLFRDIFFDNAPNTKEDCIIAEKGEWVK